MSAWLRARLGACVRGRWWTDRSDRLVDRRTGGPTDRLAYQVRGREGGNLVMIGGTGGGGGGRKKEDRMGTRDAPRAGRARVCASAHTDIVKSLHPTLAHSLAHPGRSLTQSCTPIDNHHHLATHLLPHSPRCWTPSLPHSLATPHFASLHLTSLDFTSLTHSLTHSSHTQTHTSFLSLLSLPSLFIIQAAPARCCTTAPPSAGAPTSCTAGWPWHVGCWARATGAVALRTTIISERGLRCPPADACCCCCCCQVSR